MEIRKAYLSMIKAFGGGWDAMAPALGMSRDALENRIYERKGQSLMVETAIQMQEFSGTKLFAEAIAVISGGTFVVLPTVDNVDNDFIQSKFNETYAELGALFTAFTAAAADGEIDAKERRQLEGLGEDLHRKTEQLLGLIFSVYCRKTKAVMMTRPGSHNG
ncbi:YmfL family putative regulatory protein [Glaciimonas sp. GNP009]